MANIKAAPKRSEVDPKYTWATEDLFATDELWFKELEELSEMPDRVAAFKGKLIESAKNLLGYFTLMDEVGLRLSRLANYAMRKSDEDTANSFYRDMVGKMMSLDVRIDSADAFSVPELLTLDEAKLASFIAEEPKLAVYERYIKKVLRRKEHTLSDAEEAILAAAGEISGTPGDIGSVFRNADLKFPSVKDSSGKEYPVTQGTFVPLLEMPDTELRKAAFKSMYDTFASYKNTTAAFLNGQVKQLMFFAKARKYANTMEASLDRTEVPVSVYHNLIKAVNDNMEYLHRYVALRKKLMGVDELHMYDIYMPIVEGDQKTVTFDEAKAACLEGLSVLGEDYLDMLREGFNNRWIDVYENEGKRSGAYSAGGDPHPYVLLNYHDTLDNQFTLAHEMGHALHSYLSRKHQPPINSHYVIFVAEVASTCNEVLLMRHLLSKTTDKRERATLINYFMEQFRTTLYRQTMFAEFEMLMNSMAEKGDSLTADALCKVYYDLNCKYYGKDMVVDPEIAYEWARIPHFFYNFYVFQYATGFSAAVAIANRILTEGRPAVEDYIRFLSSGGSQDPISLLKIAGVDMTTAKPVEDALKLFGELIDEMEALMK